MLTCYFPNCLLVVLMFKIFFFTEMKNKFIHRVLVFYDVYFGIMLIVHIFNKLFLNNKKKTLTIHSSALLVCLGRFAVILYNSSVSIRKWFCLWFNALGTPHPAYPLQLNNFSGSRPGT